MARHALPTNASHLEKALALSFNSELLTLDLGEIYQFNIQAFYDDLFWQFGIEYLNFNFLTPSQQRELLKYAISWQGVTGTPFAIKKIAELLGFGVVEVLEAKDSRHFYDGSIKYNGVHHYSQGLAHWYEFSVICKSGQVKSRVDLLREIIEQVKPARCTLKQIIFTAPQHYNGEYRYNGELYYA